MDERKPEGNTADLNSVEVMDPEAIIELQVNRVYEKGLIVGATYEYTTLLGRVGEVRYVGLLRDGESEPVHGFLKVEDEGQGVVRLSDGGVWEGISIDTPKNIPGLT